MIGPGFAARGAVGMEQPHQQAVVFLDLFQGSARFDAEHPMALMNRHLTGVETVFVVGDPRLAHIASSMVKDVARHGGDIAGLVPDGVAAAVRAALVTPKPSPSGGTP